MNSSDRLWTRDFTLLCGAHFALSLAFYASMPVLPLFLRDRMGVEGLALGAVIACYTIAAITARPVAGWVLDNFGRRVVYLPTYLIFALLYFLYPLARSALDVAALRLAHGLAWGAVMGAAVTLAVDLMPPSRRGEGIGFFSLFMTLAMGLGPALGDLLSLWVGYDRLFLGAGALILAGFLLLPGVRVPRVRLEGRPFSLSSVLEKSALPVTLSVFFVCMPFGALMNFSVLYAESVLGAFGGIFFAAFALGTGLSRLFSGKIYDRRGPGAVMRAAFVLLLAGLIMLALVKDKRLYYLAGFIQGLGDGMAIPVMQAMINALTPPERRGAANATFMTGFDLGICCGIVCTGFLYKAFGWPAAFTVLAGCIAAAAAVFAAVALPRYRKAIKTAGKR